MEKQDLELFFRESLNIRLKYCNGKVTRYAPLIFLSHLFALAKNFLTIFESKERLAGMLKKNGGM